MKAQIVNYLLLEHLPSLLGVFENGFKKIALNNPAFLITGKVINALDKDNPRLEQLLKDDSFNLICANMEFPFSDLENFNSTMDFLAFVRKHYPEIKVMVTMQSSNVYSLRKLCLKINPKSILEATDCNQKTIDKGLKELLETDIFYSKTIVKLLRIFVVNNDTVDDIDYRILFELGQGTKNAELPDKLFLSGTTINKRKNKLKEFFLLEGQADSQLVKQAKELRYI